MGVYTFPQRYLSESERNTATGVRTRFSRTIWFTFGQILMVPGIGIMVRMFANGSGDLGSIPGRVIPKTKKIVLDTTLLNIQHYKVRIKGKLVQSRERSSALPYTLV